MGGGRFGFTMKKAVALFFLKTLVFGQEIIEFKTGTSFGECLGYCLSELTINANNAGYTLYGWDENDPVYLPVAINDTIDSIVWGDLNTQFNFEIFMNLDSIIGCPDCADGGAEWFEIATNDTVKRVTIEYGDSLNGLNNYIDILRTIRYSFQEIQSCYLLPNVGPCDADIPRYYFDQEENQCMEFSWGGCAGLVPFETLEDCESNCNDNENELLSQTGYLRKTETSFCMDSCSVYYFEDEYGEFLTHVTQLDSIEILNDYVNRFVKVEGDTVQCVECEAINIISIEISDDCQWPVTCFANPCEVSECTSNPDAECEANYCGGCWADYYLNHNLINCDLSMDCFDLTGIDFGNCDMVLGIGWVNDNCETISGCDWVADSVDYTAAFFNSMDDCIEACFLASTNEINQLPHAFNLYNSYPNPFNPVTTLHYDLPENALVNITIYDIMGRVVRTLINTQQNAGFKSIQWNATDDAGSPLSAGLYLYKLQAGNFVQTRKMVLLK